MYPRPLPLGRQEVIAVRVQTLGLNSVGIKSYISQLLELVTLGNPFHPPTFSLSVEWRKSDALQK